MSEVESQPDSAAADSEATSSADAPARATPKRRLRIPPLLLTMLAAAAAVTLGRAAWDAYMGAPWTRDATVRAYVVTMAPEVSGRIVELPVRDNELVHKGALLLAIDPTNYEIAVSQAEAAVRLAQASVQNIDSQMQVQQAQIRANQAQLDQALAALVFAQQQAGRYRTLAHDGWGTIQNAQQYASQLHQQEAAVQTALANFDLVRRQVQTLKAQRMSAEATLGEAAAQLRQAQVNLKRTRIISPADGYVTNLLAHRGDYVNVGMDAISVVVASSFWVDGYFEETSLRSIHVGDPVEIKLMGYPEVVRGHVDSIARAISVANAQPNGQGLANVNPIFTWVRLAQRIPVRIRIDEVPEGIVLVAGMTATVQIDDRSHRSPY